MHGLHRTRHGVDHRLAPPQSYHPDEKRSNQAAGQTSTTPAKLDGGGMNMPSSRMPSR